MIIQKLNYELKCQWRNYFKQKWHIFIYFIFLVIIVILTVTSADSDIDNRFAKYSSNNFHEKWHYDFGEGTTGETVLPGELPKTDSTILTLSNTIPKLEEPASFFFRARHTAVRIYVDGKVVLDQIGENSTQYDAFTPKGIFYHEILLHPEDSEKEIRIESRGSVSRYLENPGNVYLGDRGTFFIYLLKKNIPTMLCAFTLLLFSILLFVMWIMGNFILKMASRELVYLSLFTLSVAGWLFTEAQVSQFMLSNAVSATILAYEILMLMPAPIALFFSCICMRAQWKKYSKIAATIPLGVFAINNMMQLLHIVSLADSLCLTQAMLGFEVIFIAWIQISEIRYMRKNVREYSVLWKVPLVGIGLLVPMALIEVAKYAFVTTKYPNDGILISLGIVIYIFTLAVNSVLNVARTSMQLKQSAELKSQFLANMSHEIRTPLNSILGFDEVILRITNEDRVKEYAANIQTAGANLKDIINSILDITKIEAGKLEIYSVEYSMLQLLDNITSMFQELAEKKGLKLITDIDEKLPEILIGDETHIRQVLTNILNNAVKYTEKGTVTLTVKVSEMSEDAPLCRLYFSVKDTGVGIKDEDKNRLFEKFERLNQVQYANTEGTGLGMSIVVQLLHAMNSEIQLDSEFGVGSDFHFELEQCVIDKKEIGDFIRRKKDIALENLNDVDFIAPKAKVLIVDDVQMNLDAVCALLEYTKMQIDTAASGKQAIEMIQEKHYDLVLMDHMMPEMDGIQATEHIRELSSQKNDPYYAQIPIIALTANAMVGMKETFLRSGMQDFISKPIEIDMLNSVIKRWLPKTLIERETENVDHPKEDPTKWDVWIQHLDLEKAREYNANFAGFEKNLKRFYDSYPDTRKKIEKYKQDKDIENYTIVVHGLKSTSKLIGAMEVSNKAFELEEKGHSGEIANAWDDTDQLFELYQQCIDSIAQYLHIGELGDSNDTKKILTDEEYSDLLQRIKHAADEFDMGAFMTLEDELQGITVAEEEMESFETVKKMIVNAAFGDLSEYLDHSGRV